MTKRRFLLAAALLATPVLLTLGCDSANPVAPPGTVLTVTANPTFISLDGVSVITVVGFRPDGNPLNPGTQINLSTDLGVLGESTVFADGSGRATTTLRGDGRSGTANVSAFLPSSGNTGGGDGGGGGGSTQSGVAIQIGNTPETNPLLTVTANPASINISEQSTISIVARNADRSPLVDGEVQLRTTLGSLRDTVLRTDGQGRAETVLTAGNQSGVADVTASVGSSEEVATMVDIGQPTLIVSANPTVVPVATGTSVITIIARGANGVALGADQRIRLTVSLGALSCGGGAGCTEVFTDANGEATATFLAGDRASPPDAQVTAILGTSEATSVSITLRDAPASFTFQATPQEVSASANADINVSVQVINAQGTALSGARVVFGTIGVGASFASGSPVHTTDQQGEANDTITVPQNELDAGETFQVTAEVSGEGAELPQRRITITVTQ